VTDLNHWRVLCGASERRINAVAAPGEVHQQCGWMLCSKAKSGVDAIDRNEINNFFWGGVWREFLPAPAVAWEQLRQENVVSPGITASTCWFKRGASGCKYSYKNSDKHFEKNFGNRVLCWVSGYCSSCPQLGKIPQLPAVDCCRCCDRWNSCCEQWGVEAIAPVRSRDAPGPQLHQLWRKCSAGQKRSGALRWLSPRWQTALPGKVSPCWLLTLFFNDDCKTLSNHFNSRIFKNIEVLR